MEKGRILCNQGSQSTRKRTAYRVRLRSSTTSPKYTKSRLYYEFTHSHRTRDRLILESGSVSYGKATAYLPVIELLEAYYQVPDLGK